MLNKVFPVVLTVLISVPLAFFAQVQSNNFSLKISGEIPKPLILTKENLSKMERTTATLKDHDGKEITYAGVKLEQILELAGVPTGKQLRGKQLTKFLLVKCSDGYAVVFSLAELDKGFNDKLVILADKAMNADIPLDEGPLRLIVPGEKVLARSSFKVSEIVVMSASNK
jgi:DMSO/TMAO reductase YedYZ molybdopterin-dependent catalytic subunit